MELMYIGTPIYTSIGTPFPSNRHYIMFVVIIMKRRDAQM